MSESVGKINLDLEVNHDQFNNQIKEIGSNAESSLGGIFKNLGETIAAAFAVDKLFEFGKESIRLASNLNEVQNVVDVTFGNMSEEINKFADNAITQFGMSDFYAKKFTSTMGAMLKSSGFTGQGLVDMSEGITTLAGNMASFYNISQEDAFDKLRSGMMGMIRPLEEMGIKMTEVDLKNFALAKGFKVPYQSMDQATQTLVRYNYIMAHTKDIQGDYARTSQSWANQTRLLSQEWDKFKETFGSGLINILSNALKGFNAFILKIQVASEYFKAFTSLVFGDAQATSKSTDSTNKLADATTKAGDAAATAAKKVSGSLGSFDQLNIIGQKAADALGGVSDDLGDVGSVDLGKTEKKANIGLAFPIDLKQIQASINEILTPLKNINFKPLIDSFDNLKTTLKPFTKDLFDGLKWFYDNILVPFAKWTIEKLIPAFLNDFADVLKALHPLIETAKPLLNWLWLEFLKPLGEWTGGVIIQTLNNLLPALTKIGKWISENKETIKNCTEVIIGFFAAWQTVKLMAFIQMSGGVITVSKDLILWIGATSKALYEMVTAYGAAMVAKLSDKAETIYLTLLYAKDFVVSITASTTALIKQAAQWVWTTTCMVANKVAMIVSTIATEGLAAAMGILNAVMELNPFVLIATLVIAIGAALYYAYTHSETFRKAVDVGWKFIKEVAMDVWNWISDKLSSFWKWINDTAIPSIKWFSDAVVNAFKAIGDFGKNIWTSIKDAFKDGINTVIDLVNWFIDKINKIQISIPKVDIPGFGEVGGNTIGFDLKSIPRLASGGLISAPTLAMVGDNRNARMDPEVVSPLSQLQNMMNSSNQGIIQVLMMILNAIEQQVPTLEIDGQKLSRILKQYNLEENNRTGKRMVTVGGIFV